MFSFYFLCLYSCLVAGIPESSLSRVEHSIQCMMGPWSIFLTKWTFLDASKSRNEPGWGRAPQFWHKNNWRETSSLLKQKRDPKLWNLSPLATQNMCGGRRAVLVGGGGNGSIEALRSAYVLRALISSLYRQAGILALETVMNWA